MASLPAESFAIGDKSYFVQHMCHPTIPDGNTYSAYRDYGRFGAYFVETIPKGESGHPIRHEFTRSIPTSQCMTCHMHPGTNMVTTYGGYTWWDNEADGEHMYPKQSRRLSDAERDEIQLRNPEGAALRGLWGDAEFLADLLNVLGLPLVDKARVSGDHENGPEP